jgi:hypothetical protein
MGSARDETGEEAYGHLERLATALMGEPNLQASLVWPSSGTPFLRVTRSDMARLTENISAASSYTGSRRASSARPTASWCSVPRR